MNKYPAVNYIGNKEKISEWIVEKIPIKSGTVLDLFCGGCSVSYDLKKHGFAVLSNDALYSNYVLAKAIIENNKTQLQVEDLNSIKISESKINEKYSEIIFLADSVYFKDEVRELAKLILMSAKLEGYKRYLFLALLRRAMIRKTPYSRMNVKWEEIQKFRDEEYSYRKYGRYRHYHNIPFLEHILLNMDEYNESVFSSDNECKAMQYDALDCIKNLETKVDLIYMDPPYPSTMNKYNDFYGKYDEMMSKNSKIKIDLTNKSTFLANFSKIVKAAVNKASYIAISLNNKCYPSCDLLLDSIKDYISFYEIFEREHVYKVTGKKNKNTNIEILLVCKMKG